MEEKKITLKPKREDMKNCFTCLLCHKLYDHATTICECLHTFCRKCIEDKLIEENLRACPICNVDLGVAPLDKLRTDNGWDNLKLSVFKPKPKIVKAETRKVAISLQYSRKKKKSLASLLATSSKVSTTPDKPNPVAPLEPEKLGEKVEAVPLIQSSSRPVSKFRKRPRKNPRPQRNEILLEPEQPRQEGENGFMIFRNTEQDNGLAGTPTSRGCVQKENNSEKDNNEEVPVSSDDLGKYLSNDKEPLKRENTTRIPKGKENQAYVSNSGGGSAEGGVSGVKPKECAEDYVLNRSEGNTEEVSGEANRKTILVSSDSETEEVSGLKLKNNNGEEEDEENVSASGNICGKEVNGKAYSPPVLRPRRQRKMNSSQDDISRDAEYNVGESRNPVWFSLLAAPNQNTNRPLPQISPLYVRVTNGNLPVSYVKKYLVKKLSLKSEDEVEIWLMDEPVCSTQSLYDLVDWWVQATPVADRKSATVGSSGADIVMVLYYSRSFE